MNDLLAQFRTHWHSAFAALGGKPVLLAVSGGVDSMALLQLFIDSSIPFAVAHCNFGLRGAASDLDEVLVRDRCLQAGVVCHITRFATKEMAAEWKKGTQETARILRYEWFGDLQQEFGYVRTVTAHHANDNVETLLMNLFRGTGIQGLHGILPDNGKLVRPLLWATREQIMEYAVANNITWRDDESNASDDYLRNAIRHNVIPEVQKLFPGMVDNVNGSIGRFAEAEQLYNKAVKAEIVILIEKRGSDHYIAIRKLRHRTPLATICYELLQPFGFTAAQIPQAMALLDAGAGKYMTSGTHRVIRDREFLVITALAPADADMIQVEGAPCTIDTDRYSFSFAIKDVPASIPADKDVAYIDAGAITFPLLLRRWRTGDHLYPLGMGMKKKKVSRLLIDLKVPLHEKEHVWVLECNKRIVWIAGIRPDERFKVRPSTRQVLVVTRTAK
ncbi:tRNA lysidine(34) synthetase TilS [Nemorincola caseinilytica]|uniref:tRNA(Ile)-lysidine synthase n=1 Tax=Nemorincola caseinilytica TaxID=2054315 RepID=A0ABP8N3C0_9BACT